MRRRGGRRKETFDAVLALVLLTALGVANLRLHRPGDTETTVAQLRFLEKTLDEGGAHRMQEWFPEGYVFTWALYGAASAQVAGSTEVEPALRAHLLGEAREAAETVRTAAARSTFPTTLNPPRGAFYASWSLYVLAEYVRAAGADSVPSELLWTFEDEAEAFAEALRTSRTPFIESYPGLAWPADAAVGVAALGIFGQVVDDRFGPVTEAWVAQARARLNPELAALSHLAFPGRDPGEVRGSSLALMSRVLVEVDPEFARAQYEVLREHFLDYRLGVPGIREYPLGGEGPGDVDSGPLVLGYSGPAVVVGAAAARVHGDERLADILLGGTELVGVPLEWSGRRRYAGGLVPVGDAFIAWARSSPLGTAGTWEPILPRGWAIPFHLLSSVIALFLAWRGGLLARAGRPRSSDPEEGARRPTAPRGGPGPRGARRGRSE